VVRDGDAVLLPEGYHPNVALPGATLNFVWIMAAHREVIDRKWESYKLTADMPDPLRFSFCNSTLFC
jgi:5-deoxy-D-glucuronate isomerase